MADRVADQQYLVDDQYIDSSNLSVRIRLHKLFSTNGYGWHRWVFDHFIDLPSDARILELGCGRGDLWIENRERIPPDWGVRDVDLLQPRTERVKGEAMKFVIAIMSLIVIGCGVNFGSASSSSSGIIGSETWVESNTLHHVWGMSPVLYADAIEGKWVRIKLPVTRIEGGNAYADSAFFLTDPATPVTTVLQGLSDKELAIAEAARWKSGVTCKAGEYDYKSTPRTLYMTDCKDLIEIISTVGLGGGEGGGY